MGPFIGILETLSLLEKRVHPRIKKVKGKKIIINNLYDSKVHSIIPIRNSKVSGGCLNGNLSSNRNMEKERCMEGFM